MKTQLGLLVILSLIIGCLSANQEIFAENAERREYHGADSVFQAEGIAIFWAILKGEDDEHSLVYIHLIRMDDAAKSFQKYGVLAVDPFSKEEKWIFEGKNFDEKNLLKLNRASFRDMMERRFFFYKSDEHSTARKPDMIVYYLSIPDTSPEFLEEHQIEEYFEGARKRLETKE